MRFLLLLIQSVMLLGLSAPLLASPDAEIPDAPLFVELVVNRKATGDLIQVRMNGEEIWVEAEDLRRAGLSTERDGFVNAAALAGVEAHYNALDQMLMLEASPDLLPVSRLGGRPQQAARTAADFGALLNYDAYFEARGGGALAGSLWTEQRIFGPFGIVSNNGSLLSNGRSGSVYRRYESFYRLVDERRALALTVGDLISRSIGWTSSVRLGGIQFGRDYDVRPDLVTVPLPSFAGKTAVPTTLDLFVDGYRQRSADVEPGRYVLDDVPVVNGAGQATIVTTDAGGRQVATTIPFYVSAQLLKPGLSDFGAELGWLRRGYGLRNFGYGPFAMSGTLRRGMTPRITIEGHGELVRGLRLAGVGMIWSPGLFGTFNLSAAASRGPRRDGAQWTAGYSYAARRFSFAAEHVRRSPGYRDLGTFDLARYDGGRRSTRIVATVNIPRQGSFGIAYLDARSASGNAARLISASYSRAIGRYASLFISGDHDLARGGSSAQLRLVVPFGRNSVGAGVSHNSRGTLAQLDYSRSRPSDGGLEMAVSLASDRQRDLYGQMSAGWRGRRIEVDAGVAVTPGRQAVWGSASGSMVMLDRHIFAAHQVNDAFALVSTGVPGVPVSYENQTFGVTDAAGYLFVSQVSSYHGGRFGIDVLGLPIDQTAETTERRVALRRGTGAVIAMPVRTAQHVTLTLTDEAGVPLEVGGLVRRSGAPDSEVGWDGIVFLQDIGSHSELSVVRRDGNVCSARIEMPAVATPLADLGQVTCR